MTTDITELAQSLKAAARKATPGQWMAFTHADSQTFSVHTPDDKRCGDIIKWAGFDGQRKAKANAEFIALANPANVLALVEALEKAQAENTAGVAGMAESYETTISMLRSRIAELEESHAQVIQSRDHYKRMSEEGLKQLAESRTVTLKLPELCVGVVQGGHAVMVPYAAGHWFNKMAILEMLNAAGIKWEAE
ncbi:ead/Ea22-like family protein [Klebsiella aerogenes]|uniref:ead/Ea22-like family protein n=1 Tax=Klebsiella aerogenes TaxID=548 RepID=UPI000D36092D|nr:ead/Ea22-like family protein [Klebsiella aerogenes]